MSSKVRVLIVDDHAIIRDGLRHLLEQAGMIVCGEAGDGRAAIELARKTGPDLIIMDLSMPIMGGIEATQRILQEHPKMKVLAVSVHKDSRFVSGAMKAGASGYLVKEYAYEEMLQAVKSVMRNRVYITKALRGCAPADT